MMAPMELTRVAAGSLVSAAWEGLVLAGVVAVCLRVLPRITAAARSVVWTLVMLAVCGLPFVRFGGASTVSGAAQVRLDERFGLGLVAVWALMSLVRAGQLFRSAVWLRGVWQRALPVEAPAGWMGGKRPAELCVSEEVDRPCVVGFLRPRVLVPTALFEEMSDGELAQIVMHEMEHLRRRDDWTNLIQKLSLVVFPLNPALIWIERQLCVERELACDDQVLKTTGARKAYAACLANLAEHSLVRRGVTLALGAWERQSEVVRRVHRILSQNEREMGRRQVAVVVAVLVAGVLAGADGLAHVSALVSFGPGVSTVAENVPQRLKPGSVRSLYGTGEPVPLTRQDVSMISAVEGPHPTLLNAVLRVKTVPVAKVGRRVLRVGEVSKPMVVAMERSTNMGHPSEHTSDRLSGIPSGEAPTVVMVRWTTMMPMIVQDLQFTYAAVPTRNGWLFVQL